MRGKYLVRAQSACLIFLPLLVALISSLSQAVEMKGLVLYVPFSEGEGMTVEDKSETKGVGKIGGGVKWTKEGKFGGAVEFAEDGYVEFPDLPSLSLVKEITMAGWIYPTGAPDEETSLWCRLSKEMPQCGYTMWWTQGKVETWLGLTGKCVGTRSQQTIKPSLNEWHFVAGVYYFERAEIIQYVDGKVDFKIAGGGPLTKVPAVFRIGKSASGRPLSSMPGKIDEVVIFNRALELPELEEIRTQGMKGFMAVHKRGKLTVSWGKMKQTP